MEPAGVERECPFVKLDSESARRFEDFLLNALKGAYGRYLTSALNVSYMGLPGILAHVDDDEGPLLEILVVYGESSVRCRVRPLRLGVNPLLLERAASLVESAVRLFAETGGYGVAYFVFVTGRQLIPPRTESKAFRTLQTLFFNNLVFVFAISMIISFIVYAAFGSYAPLVLVLMQVPLMLLVHKLIPFMIGDWLVDPAHREVYLIGIRMPLERYQELLQRVLAPRRFEIKRMLYATSLGLGAEPTEQQVKSVLAEYGLDPQEYAVEVRRIDLYGIVERVSRAYGFSRPPKVYVSNTVVPNAAATGIGGPLSAVIVMTGLLTRLDDEEIEAVLGHELSHLRHHDVLTYFFLSSAEYLTRVYLALRFWPVFATLGFVYLWFSLTLLFFLAKFVEARADLDSALALGKPDKLASALKKIGFRHLYLERRERGRLMAWLRWDPHPPITYRIETLEALASGRVISGPWRAAVAGCIKDFLRTIRWGL